MDTKDLRGRVLAVVAPRNPALAKDLLVLLDEFVAAQHENESWRLIDEQHHRDRARWLAALTRLAGMDYACDDKDCAAPDVANAALDPAKN